MIESFNWDYDDYVDLISLTGKSTILFLFFSSFLHVVIVNCLHALIYDIVNDLLAGVSHLI